MSEPAPRPSVAELQQRLQEIEIKQEQGVERLAAMRAAGFRMDRELRELRAALDRLTEEVGPADTRGDTRSLIPEPEAHEALRREQDTVRVRYIGLCEGCMCNHATTVPYRLDAGW